MPKWLFIASALVMALACNAPFMLTPTPPPAGITPEAPETPASVDKPGWKLVFHDEFDDSSLSPKWATELRWGRLNPPELQFYWRDAFKLQDGLLRITAEHRPLEGQNYTSGVIATFSTFHFQYGYAEIRSRVPAGKGLWPAFWLLDSSDTGIGEIDVLEILGQEPNKVYMTLHYPDANGNSASKQGEFTGPDFSAGFHTFAVDWRKDSIVWYVDGVERYRLTENIPQGPMYVIANLAVGGKWPGSPSVKTPFPAYFDIDYIRVYQQAN
ncbi:MAG: glycoside hydrolase family 16 protein [Chloroflexi bacterium]|nr:glycoside hydrolase family 16 protein [Chloroflexota bacterium]